MKSKQQLGKEIRHEIDVFFGEREKQEDGISYLDVCQLTDHIEERLESEYGELPNVIEGSIKMARAMVNPSKAASLSELRKGLGLLVTTAGGAAVVFGIMAVLGVGADLWAKFVAIFSGGLFPVLGPLAIVVGVALFAAGIYFAITRIPQSVRSSKAHDTIIKGISMWERKDDELEDLDQAAIDEAKKRSKAKK